MKLIRNLSFGQAMLCLVALSFFVGSAVSVSAHPGGHDDGPMIHPEKMHDKLKAAMEELPSGEWILERYGELVGGDDFSDMQSFHGTGTFSMPAQGVSGKLQFFAKAPNKLAIKVTIPSLGDVQTGFDGVTGWATDPMSGPRLLEGTELEEMMIQADFADMVKPTGKYKEIETVGVETIEDKECYKVRLVRKDGGKESFEYYDIDTGLQVAEDGVHASPMGEVEVRTFIDEHMKVSNLLIPSVTRQSIMGMEQVMILDEITMDAVTDDAFVLPAEIQGLLEAKKKRDAVKDGK